VTKSFPENKMRILASLQILLRYMMESIQYYVSGTEARRDFGYQVDKATGAQDVNSRKLKLQEKGSSPKSSYFAPNHNLLFSPPNLFLNS